MYPLLYNKLFYEKVITISKNVCLVLEKEPTLDADIHSLHIKAVEFFFQKHYLATVFFASIGVETYLNKILKENNWINLNSQLIKKAYETGIVAVTELLDKSEKTVLTKAEPKPIFCGRRNKVLHGEFEGLFELGGSEIETRKVARSPLSTHVGMKDEDTIDISTLNYLECAYDQLLKFQKFLLKL